MGGNIKKSTVLWSVLSLFGLGGFSIVTVQIAPWGDTTPSSEVPDVATGHGTPITPGSEPPGAAEITPPIKYATPDDARTLFDPESGKPQVYFSGDPEGEIHFSSAEYDPTTGEKLKPLTRESLATYRAAVAARAEKTTAATTANPRDPAVPTGRRSAPTLKERYVNTSVLSRLERGAPLVLLAVDDDAFEARLAEALRGRGVPIRTNLFRRAIFADAVYDRLVVGDQETLEGLGLSGFSGKLLLCRLNFEELKASDLRSDLLNTRAHLTTNIVPLGTGQPVTLAPLSDIGAGFDAAQAHEMGQKKLIELLLDQPLIASLGG